MRRRFIQTNGGIDINNYLTIEALEDGLTVTLTKGYSVYYCINGSGEWKQLLYGVATSPINNGDTISFKDGDGLIRFSISKQCNLLGTIMSIAYGDYWTENSVAPLSNGMFRECTTIVSVDENFLPATTLSENCYYALFYNCISLVNAPVLPATTLCLDCYNYMFYGCNRLNYIKALFTTTPRDYYTNNWVLGVASTGTFIKNPEATWDVVGDSGVPEGWRVKFDGEEDEKIVNTITIKVTWDDILEIGNLYITASYPVASDILIYDGSNDAYLLVGETSKASPLIYTPNNNQWSISPSNDDTYIYQIIIEV